MSINRKFWISMMSYSVLGLLLVTSVVPIVMMLMMSLRDTLDIYGDFWGVPLRPKWQNYSSAMLALIEPMIRSLFLCFTSIFGVLALAAFCGYAFARLKFWGKGFLFFLIVMMMTLPKVLQLTPNFLLADWMQLRNTYTGLIAFYIGGGLLFAVFLLRSFFRSISEELFEAARMEGSSEYICVVKIALPLAKPIFVTIAIMTFLGIYNDLIWPMLMISSPKLQTLAMALQSFAPKAGGDAGDISNPDLGVITSGYVFASIPLLIVFLFGMKYYVEGLTSGAVKS
ncbi:carbohydrate ABC transporter permease [Paenibacillus agaridevorans]|uniref:Carbohydrate ABC transporter permease n=1 Tax=Paenibacillus agaridevorans TaxID=171404 RepID=A0A2R5ELX4_9BACL|nr:carbohydrate ABC transporter permease [Paenibacillus agaridevorans]GBG05968.1 carbohydrate ABC transporter permease [Paenibacillus agaridevorans]